MNDEIFWTIIKIQITLLILILTMSYINNIICRTKKSMVSFIKNDSALFVTWMLLNYIIGLIPIMLSFTNSEIDINGIYFNIATILTVALASNFYNASTDKKRKNDSEACDKSKFRLCAAFSVTMLIFITTFSHIKNISSNFFFICICSAVVITSIILAWINYKLTSDYEEKHSDDIGNIAERHVINQDMDEVGATDEW